MRPWNSRSAAIAPGYCWPLRTLLRVRRETNVDLSSQHPSFELSYGAVYSKSPLLLKPLVIPKLDGTGDESVRLIQTQRPRIGALRSDGRARDASFKEPFQSPLD